MVFDTCVITASRGFCAYLYCQRTSDSEGMRRKKEPVRETFPLSMDRRASYNLLILAGRLDSCSGLCRGGGEHCSAVIGLEEMSSSGDNNGSS